jgi:hypothetical protein
MLSKKRRLISCLLGFCLCLNLLFPVIAFAQEPEPVALGFDLNHPDDCFIGGDNYAGIIDQVRVYPEAIILPTELEPEPVALGFDLNHPDDCFIGGDNYAGIIDQVRVYPEAIILPTELEPEPVELTFDLDEPGFCFLGKEDAITYIGGDNYSGCIDETAVYEATVGVSNHAPTIIFRGLSNEQEVSAIENILNFQLVIEDEDWEFDTKLETEIYIGFAEAYRKVTTFTVNDVVNNKGKFTAQNRTEYDISINKGAYVPKYVTKFTIKVVATDTLGEEGEEELTLVQFSNLLAQWPLDSVRDGIAVDSSGLGNNGVIQGAALTTGIIDNAVALDGVDDYVEIPLTPDITLTTDSFSVEAWVKSSDEPSVDKGVVGNYVMATTPYWMLKQCGGADIGKFGFSIRDAAENVANIVSAESFNDGSWHHLVGVRDTPNKKVAFYVDGTLVLEVTADLGDVNNEQNICFGLHLDNYFQGCLDEVTLYGCALSQQEVAQKYEKIIFLKNITMTNEHNGETDDFCTFGVHKNNLEFDLQKTVKKLDLELDLPSSVKVVEIEKVAKRNEGGTYDPLSNPDVTFTEKGAITFSQTLDAGHYQVELLLNIDEDLTIKAKSFCDEKELKINYDSDIFGFKFMDSDAMPNVL